MTTIGRVDFVVGLDGTTLPRRAFVVGRQIGKSIGAGIDQDLSARFRALGISMQRQLGQMGAKGGLVLADNFGRSVERRLGPRLKTFFAQMGDVIGDGLTRRLSNIDFDGIGDDLGHLTVVVREVSSGMDRLAISAGGAGRGMGGFGDNVRSAGDAADDDRFGEFERMMGRLNGAFGLSSERSERFANGLRRIGNGVTRIVAQRGQIGQFFRNYVASAKEADDASDGLLQRWKQIPHGARQFAFYTALFANLADQIAVLGAAAGAGLLTLGGGAAFGAVGLTAAIVAFTGLSGELSDLPAEIQPAVASLRGLGDEFKELRKQLQVRTLSALGPAFDSLRSTVRALTPDIAALGDNTSSLIRSLAEGLAPGTKNFARLRTLIKSSGPVFERIVRIVGRFGEGLLAAFASPALLRSVNEMLDWLGDLADGFLAFTESEGLTIWLGRASTVFAALGRLLEGTGKLLNDLVDAEAVGRLNGFLSNITDFLPSLTTILDVLGEFDIFGLIAQALADFGEALAPLGGPMRDLAEALNDVVQAGIERLSPIFNDIAEGLAPVVQAVADFIAANPQGVADAMLAIAGAAVILKGTEGLSGLAAAVTTNLSGMATSLKASDWKSIGTKFGKAGAAAFLPALIAGLFSGEGGAGITIGTGALIGLTQGSIPGLLAGALVGAVVSMFTDGGAWANGFQQIVDFMTPFFEGLFSSVGGFFEALSTGFLESIGGFFAEIGAGIGGFFEPIISGFANGWSQIVAGVSFFFTSVQLLVSTGVAIITSFFTTFFANIAAGWNGFWAGLGVVVTAAWKGFTGAVSSGWSAITGFFSGAFGALSRAWNGFWSGLGGIVVAVWANITSTVRGAVNTVVGLINGLISSINGALSKISSITGGLVNLSIPSLPKMASGGILWGPTNVTAGEAGPEAIVPLNRPLNQVDPAVRGLSAVAQGKGGYSGGAGKQIINNVEAGAIAIYEVRDGRLAADAALDRLALATGS